VDYLRYTEFVTNTSEQADAHRATDADDVNLIQKYSWLASYHDDRAPAGARVAEDRPPRRFPLL
jgi:hypothetical protein